MEEMRPISLDRRPTLGDAIIIFVVAEVVGLALHLIIYKVLTVQIWLPLPSITYLVVGSVHLFVIRRIKSDAIGFRMPVHITSLLPWLILGAAYGVVSVLIEARFSPSTVTPQPEMTRAAVLALLADAILLSPAAGELFFRGVLFTALEKKLGSWVSIGIVVLIDVFFHLPHMLRGKAFILHICVRLALTLFCLTALYWRKRDLALNIVTHSAINAGIILAQMRSLGLRLSFL